MSQCQNCLSELKDQFEQTGVCGTCIKSADKLSAIRALGNDVSIVIDRLSQDFRAPKFKWDVCIGISGGVDSCMVATLAGEAGLRVKLVHFDNGWNTAEANQNIFLLCQRYRFDLETHVMDWGVFRSLQRSFLMSSVPDIELVTDHAIFATMIKILARNDAPVFLSGGNFSTEHGLDLGDLVWNKLDFLNIYDINRAFEGTSLNKYPSAGPIRWAWYRFVSRSARIEMPLNWYWYKRNEAVEYMKDKFGFRDYGYKHEESIFTKVYQRTILKNKFKCIKILPHLNAQIRNQEFTRDEAHQVLENFISDSGLDPFEVEYVADKLGFSSDEWISIMKSNTRSHREFLNLDFVMAPVMRILSQLGLRAMTK